jgi:hypothetical protein
MKRLTQALVIATFAALPLVSHAADTAPVSRAQVRAELFAAARTGQYPQSDTHYPDAAPDPAIAYAARRAQEADSDTSYGASAAGNSASGKRVSTRDIGANAGERPPLGNLYSHP